jgi:hypothetical protein
VRPTHQGAERRWALLRVREKAALYAKHFEGTELVAHLTSYVDADALPVSPAEIEQAARDAAEPRQKVRP